MASGAGAPDVTNAQLQNGLADTGTWLNYGGDYSGQRHSPLTQITPANVDAALARSGRSRPDTLGKFESTPLVLDGILTSPGRTTPRGRSMRERAGSLALPARSARRHHVCCGRVNRGFAVLGDRLFMTTLDAHLLALDMKTGAIVWDVGASPTTSRATRATVAPLVVKDKVIVGIAGGEYGIRGFIDAYDAATGKRAWRFWTVPGPGEKGSETWEGDSWKRGGGSTWVTGSYDPALNLIYWGTGNPGPDLYGDDREGDNLYTDSVVALDADTGTLKWHYQFTPHDMHDWDATQVPVLADQTINGVPRKVLMFANRNGFFYTLDRDQRQAAGLAAVRARRPGPRRSARRQARRCCRTPIRREKGTEVCPDITGGTNFMSPAYNPKTGLLYVTAREVCATYYGWEQEFVAGRGLLRRRGAARPGAATARCARSIRRPAA